LESFSKDPIKFLANDAYLYRYLFDCPTVSTDPSGLKICNSFKYRDFDKLFDPPVLPGDSLNPKLQVGETTWEFTIDRSGEFKECEIDCDCKRKGKDYSGTVTVAFQAKVSANTGTYLIGVVPIKTKIYGDGEGGGTFTASGNTCVGNVSWKGCGYLGFKLGFEGCTEDLGLGIQACVKGGVFPRYQWCLDGASETCIGAKTTASACWWRNRCVEYTPVEWNNCQGADAGGV